MENPGKGKLLEGAVSAKEILSSDIPADEIEENKDEVESGTDSDSHSDSSSDSNSDSEFECDVCNKTFSGYVPFKQHQKGRKHAKAVLRKKKEKKLSKDDATTESDQERLVQDIYAECKICEKDFSGPEAYQQHLKCKKHKQKILVASILEQVREDGKINEDKLRDLCKSRRTSESTLEYAKEKITSLPLGDEDEENQEEFECKECEKLFSGLIPYTQHLLSKTHAKTAEKKKLLHRVIPETSEDDKTPIKSKHDDVNTLCLEDNILVCKACSTSFSGPENAVTHMKSKKHAKNLEKYIRKLEKKKEKKLSKEVDLNSNKEIKREQDSQEEKRKEKQSTSDDSDKLETSNNCTDNSAKASTSTNQANEGLIAYEKYKQYKALMNSLPEEGMLK